MHFGGLLIGRIISRKVLNSWFLSIAFDSVLLHSVFIRLHIDRGSWDGCCFELWFSQCREPNASNFPPVNVLITNNTRGGKMVFSLSYSYLMANVIPETMLFIGKCVLFYLNNHEGIITALNLYLTRGIAKSSSWPNSFCYQNQLQEIPLIIGVFCYKRWLVCSFVARNEVDSSFAKPRPIDVKEDLIWMGTIV